MHVWCTGWSSNHPMDGDGGWEQKMDSCADGTLFSMACRFALLQLFTTRSKLCTVVWSWSLPSPAYFQCSKLLLHCRCIISPWVRVVGFRTSSLHLCYLFFFASFSFGYLALFIFAFPVRFVFIFTSSYFDLSLWFRSARCFVFPSFISELYDLAACGVLVSSFYTLKFELWFLVLDELCVKSWLRYWPVVESLPSGTLNWRQFDPFRFKAGKWMYFGWSLSTVSE